MGLGVDPGFPFRAGRQRPCLHRRRRASLDPCAGPARKLAQGNGARAGSRGFFCARKHAAAGTGGENPRRKPPSYSCLVMGDGLVRLTEPLVREGGRLRTASWDEALTRAADGFAAARDKGPNAFGMFSCSKTTNEMNFMAQKFTRAAMHSNNIDSCNRT